VFYIEEAYWDDMRGRVVRETHTFEDRDEAKKALFTMNKDYRMPLEVRDDTNDLIARRHRYGFITDYTDIFVKQYTVCIHCGTVLRQDHSFAAYPDKRACCN